MFEQERFARDQEDSLKDRFQNVLQKQLRDAQEARREEVQSGMTFEELRDRLQKR